MPASSVVRPEAAPRERAPVRAWRLLAPILGGPLLALMVHQAEYLLVPWACDRGWRWPLHLAALVALAGTLGLAASVLGLARAPDAPEAAAHHNSAAARAARRVHFMAQLGVLAGALGALVVVAYWIAVMVLDPCHRA